MLTLHGIIAKLERAEEDIDQLSLDLAEFCDIQRRSTKMETDSDHHQINLTFRGSPTSLPLRHSIQIGEIAYNMRSALDHLLWQLVLANFKSPSKSNEFPIFTDPEGFQKAKRRKLAGVSRESVARITMMQPFCKDPRWSHLGALQELCNIDKHRTLHLLQLRWDLLIDSQGDRAIRPKINVSKNKEVELVEGQVLCSIPEVQGVSLAPKFDVKLVDSYFEGVGKQRSADDEPHTAFALRELLTNVRSAIMFLAEEILASPFEGPPKKFGITTIDIPETEENKNFNDAPKYIRDTVIWAYVNGELSDNEKVSLERSGPVSFNGTIHTSAQDVAISSQVVSETIEWRDSRTFVPE